MRIFGIRRTETRPSDNKRALKVTFFTFFFLPLFYFPSFSYAEDDILDDMITEFLETEQESEKVGEESESKNVEDRVASGVPKESENNMGEEDTPKGAPKVLENNVAQDNTQKDISKDVESTVEIQAGSKQNIQNLLSALRKQPRSASLHYKIGRAYLDKGNTERAIKHLRVANYRQNYERLLWLARAYEKAGQYKKQVKTMEVLVKKYPANYDFFIEFARAYLKNDDAPRAISVFKEAIALQPKRKLAYVESIKVADENDKSYELETLLESMKKQFGREPFVYNNFCKYYSKGSFYKGVDTCREAIQLNPGFADNHVYLGLSYIQQDNVKKGTDLIFQTARRFPSSVFAQKTAGDLSVQNQNWQRAVEYFHQCVRTDNKYEYCFLELAKAKFELGEYKSALHHFKSACDLQLSARKEMRKAVTKLIFKRKDEIKKLYEYTYQQCGKPSSAFSG